MCLREKMLAVMADVNASVAEREEVVELIAIALLTRKNLFLLGEPGQAKSYAINAFRSRIIGEGSLSVCFPSRRTKNSFSADSIFPASFPALCRNLCSRVTAFTRTCALICKFYWTGCRR